MFALALGAGMTANAQEAVTAGIAPAGEAEVRSFDVAGGPLAQVLGRYAGAAGVTLSFDASQLGAAHSDGLRGSYTVQGGFARLLSGTGLEASRTGDGRYVLRRLPAGATTLPEVRVAAQAGRNDLPQVYAGGQVARGSRIGMLGNSDMFKTPFSVKSYTNELIRNQSARNVNDVVANDPSIRTSLSATSPLDQSAIRGFMTNSDGYLFDGVEGLIAYSNVPIQHYERLEVLKGPAGGVVGASGYGSTVGGTFNLVPKRATDAPVRSATVYANDKSLFGTHIDIGQRFGTDNRFGFRLNMTAEDGELYDDAERHLVAPQIALDYRGDGVRLALDAGYSRRKSSPLFNHWILAPGAALPAVPDPSVHIKPKWETLDVRQTFGLVSAEWDVADDWTAYVRYGKLHENTPERLYIDNTTIDGAGRVTYDRATSLLWTQENEVGTAGVRGQFDTGSVKHQLSVAILRQRHQLQDMKQQTRLLATPVVADLYGYTDVPNPFADGTPDIPGVTSPALYLNSVAIADTLSMFDERLLLTLALRNQTIKQGASDHSKTTPTVAALYKIDNGLSIYGNYAESLAKGQTATAGSNIGENLPPYVSKQREVGLKWDRGHYGITAAYFDIIKTTAFLDSDNVFRAAGEQQHRGIELETFGEVAKGVRLLGGVAWIDGKMQRTQNGTFDGAKPIGVPELNVNLGAEVDLAQVPGMTLSARVIHTGAAYADLANTQRLPSWNRVDIGARYQMRLGERLVTLRAGIDNLLDDAHWTIGGRNFISVAPPRTWLLSASMDF
ncbi:TonB-dependent receptor [Oxalicibacterium flavum]|uniref:TonB-dependent receptor n=1 Tax=Oxalicibacterium flavum TaxID=179467 RepID=UPI001E5834D0|nr:TonB-dependent receptor [Oxalicibacterium flavum]